MKRIHTEARKARRISGFQKSHGKTQSAAREYDRAGRHPLKPKTYGQQVHHVQRIVKERHIGVCRQVVVKIIPHAAEA